jgi:Icc-related predicted phosphoesterase
MRLLRPRVLFAGVLLLLELPILATMAFGALVTGLLAAGVRAWRWLSAGSERLAAGARASRRREAAWQRDVAAYRPRREKPIGGAMGSQHVIRVLCAADPRGSEDAVQRLLAVAERTDVQAVALVGDLGDGHNGYRDLFRAFGGAGRPVFWVPGGGDAPVDRYLRDAHDIEIAFPQLHGVHGTAAFASGEVLFSGLGGEISDDPDAARDEREQLRYPRWEPEYRLKLLRELDYNELVLLFWTPPAHKGRATAGSEVLAEMIGTYRPRLVVYGGERNVEVLGRSLAVAPGSLADGYYAVADLHKRTVELAELAAAAA